MYELRELVDLNIDSWVEAMGHLDDIFHYTPEDECPAEYEYQAFSLCFDHKVRFNADGDIVAISF